MEQSVIAQALGAEAAVAPLTASLIGSWKDETCIYESMVYFFFPVNGATIYHYLFEDGEDPTTGEPVLSTFNQYLADNSTYPVAYSEVGLNEAGTAYTGMYFDYLSEESALAYYVQFSAGGGYLFMVISYVEFEA